jgi:hypothetical protein
LVVRRMRAMWLYNLGGASWWAGPFMDFGSF